jgi:hypothetical protein
VPWSGDQFQSRHNHALSPAQSAHAARIANAILAKHPGQEGLAIAVANKRAAGRAEGGSVLGGYQFGGTLPTAQPMAAPHPSGMGAGMGAPHMGGMSAGPPHVGMPRVRQSHMGMPHLGGIRGFADGGELQATPGGLAPSDVTQNPMYAGMIKQYANMSPEQLQEFVMRSGNSPQGQVAQKLLTQKRMMGGSQTSPQLQAQQQQQVQGAQALSNTQAISTPSTAQSEQGYARGGFAGGGSSPMGISSSEAAPWWTRAEARSADSGFINSAVPGRTDHIPQNPAADSYVIPAEEVAGLGEGNSLAGAHMLSMAFGMGPYGTRMPAAHRGSGPPHATPPRLLAQESRGGARSGVGQGEVPIMAAGGEFIVPPHIVAAVGRGNARRGHQVLDKFVMRLRQQHMKTLRKLPGPVRQ